MRNFIVRAPDGRLLPREGETLAAVKDPLIEGYAVEFEVLNGVQVPPLPDGLPRYSLFTYLLRENSDELRTWLNVWLLEMESDKALAALVMTPERRGNGRRGKNAEAAH